MLIDTHAHLYLEQFDDDLDNVIQNTKNNNIEKIFLPNIDNSTTARMLDLVKKDSDLFKPMMGLHPGSVDKNYKSELETIRQELETGKYFGVGEVGIDLYWDKTFKKEQIEAFDTQVKWAKEFDLPVIIHARDAMDLTIEIIEKNLDGKLKGIFHCFTGDINRAFRIMKTEFYMGIGGILTYKNSGLKDTVKEIPLEYLVLETDSPYLPPVPYRGKRNESAYLIHIATELAKTKNLSLKEVAGITTKNAKKIFSQAFE